MFTRSTNCTSHERTIRNTAASLDLDHRKDADTSRFLGYRMHVIVSGHCVQSYDAQTWRAAFRCAIRDFRADPEFTYAALR
jgi:hypothetical protein